MKLRPQMLFAEFSLFLAVQLLGLWVAHTILKTIPIPKIETGPSILWFLLAFIVATALIIILLRFFKGPVAFGALFSFLIFIGSDIVFSTFLPRLIALALAIAVVGVRILWPNVLSHNFAIILAVAGVSAQLGIMLTVPAVIILLIVLSVYDVWAVFKTKHMVKMAKGLIQRGMPPTIIIPENIGALGAPIAHVRAEKLRRKADKGKFLLLGSGDLAFPLIFAVAALEYGLQTSFAIIVGALAGILIVHYLLAKGKIRALPALPPIAAGSIIAFLISLLIV